MIFDVFYCCYGSGDDVAGSDPVSLNSEDLWPKAQRILIEPDDFFGVVDASGTTLQTIVDADRTYWTEIPTPNERGSYGAKLTQPQLRNLLEGLPAAFDPTLIPNAEFTPW